MKKIIFLRGPMGAGKSSFLEKIDMDSHVVSTDAIRLVLSGSEMDASGRWGISQEISEKTWGMVFDVLSSRMKRGETLAVDSMLIRSSESQQLFDKAKENGYEIAVVNFQQDLNIVQAQNSNRRFYKVVSESVVNNIHKEMVSTSFNFPEGCSIFNIKNPEDVSIVSQQVKKWLTYSLTDLSQYDSIVHIGDLQGCKTVLFGKNGPIADGLNKKSFYIFHGDLVDRGIENGEVMRSVIDLFKNNDNVKLIWGNHEDHLYRFSQGLSAFSGEFRNVTLPQLEAAGILPSEVSELLSKASPLFLYQWNGQKVCCTHAGLPGLPPEDTHGNPMWHLIPQTHLTKGVGYYSTDIDQIWEDQNNGWVQVHGHRNGPEHPNGKHSTSFNLEGRVEFGGELRLVTLSDKGWIPSSYENHVFRGWRERFSAKVKKGEEMNEEEIIFENLPVPKWIQENNSGTLFDSSLLTKMRDHSGVKEKKMNGNPNIHSLNFTSAVFFEKSWDDVVIKARGLFFNDETHEVVARGYDKFFNIGERPEVELASLKDTLNFPVTVYIKENGFLGNLGYDSQTDSLLFASKSTDGGDFAKWFRDIFESQVDADTLIRIKHYLRDSESSMVFEVIDPDNDPHMIEYSDKKVVLLDVFRRSTEMERLPYDDMKKVANHFGIEAKSYAFKLPSHQALSGWLRSAYSDMRFQIGGKDVEGFVVEDSKGYMTKIKLPFYGFWKTMRGQKNRLMKLKDELSDLQAQINLESTDGKSAKYGQAREALLEKIERCLKSDSHPLASAFMAWCDSIPVASLNTDIIDLRNQFEIAYPEAIKLRDIAWDKFDPSEKEPVKVKRTMKP